jgi:hypothetical protein
MPGTGASLPASDPNLVLNTANGTLDITTTTSDYNGQVGIDGNESLAVNLASAVGFNGNQDVNVTAIYAAPVPSMGAIEPFDQIGTLVGIDTTNGFTRAGTISFNAAAAPEIYSQNNTNGIEWGGHFFGFGFNGTNGMTTTVLRNGGVWHHYINGTDWTVFDQPLMLNGTSNLVAGVFALDTGGNHKPVSLDTFTAMVFTGMKVSASASGGNLSISWNAVGARLEENTSLANPAGWTTVTAATTSPYVIALPTTGLKFYRIAN